MITDLYKKIEQSLKDSGLITKVISFIDENDIEKMVNVPDLPVAGISIEPSRVSQGGIVYCSVTVYISDLSSNNDTDLYNTKDKAVTVLRTLFRDICELEDCNIDTVVSRENELSSIGVVTIGRFKSSL